jgi:tetratricopeptide (TPR) repeat protein
VKKLIPLLIFILAPLVWAEDVMSTSGTTTVTAASTSETITANVSTPSQPSPVDVRHAAVSGGHLQTAIVDYAQAVRKEDAALLAEYGWVLAKAGKTDLALAQADRALQLDNTNDEVLFYTSEILKSLGLTDVSSEISRPAPEWIKNEKLPADTARPALVGTYKEDINSATGLLLQRRYASSVDRYSRLTKKYPREHYVWAGYAIALESIGAYKAASQAVAKDIELSKDADEKTRNMMLAHKKELEERPALAPHEKAKANEMLEGRYLVFFGGSISHMTDDTIINISGRAGKFLTNNFDIGINAGLISGNSNSDYNGVSLGLSARYLTPLPVAAPLSFVMGARVQYAPAPSDQTTIYASPGLSYFLENGSIDLTVDFGLSGPLKDTRTVSLGYTMYLGGNK